MTGSALCSVLFHHPSTHGFNATFWGQSGEFRHLHTETCVHAVVDQSSPRFAVARTSIDIDDIVVSALPHLAKLITINGMVSFARNPQSRSTGM